MKSIKTITSVLALTAALTPQLVRAQASGSHGGDGLVFEFTGTANNIADQMAIMGQLSHCPSAELFKNTVSTDLTVAGHTTVKSAPIVLVNYVEQDAESLWQTHTITLNRSRLTNLTDPLAYFNVVMHEYFVILKLETTNDNSKSLACIGDMKAAGMTNETVTKLVFRISPISTFEKQFSQGLAGLECGSTRLLMTNFKKGRGNIVRATLSNDGVLRQSTEFAARTDSESILHTFKSEYSVNEGVTRFKALFTEACENFTLESYDHATWTVTESDANLTCTYVENGTRYRTNPGRVHWSSVCKPVYYQQRPRVILKSEESPPSTNSFPPML